LSYWGTNPESEDEVNLIDISEISDCLSFRLLAKTNARDHFDDLYEFGENSVMWEKGYVCHCTADEVRVRRDCKERKRLSFEIPQPDQVRQRKYVQVEGNARPAAECENPKELC
jgi:glutamyl/glutaminyl-tRNA synthetase